MAITAPSRRRRDARLASACILRGLRARGSRMRLRDAQERRNAARGHTAVVVLAVLVLPPRSLSDALPPSPSSAMIPATVVVITSSSDDKAAQQTAADEKQRRRRRALFAWLCCCLVGLALGLGLGLGLRLRRHVSPSPPGPPPPSPPLPSAPLEVLLPETVPTVLFAMPFFNTALAATISAGGASPIAASVAAALGTSASAVSVTAPVDYMLQFTLVMHGASAAAVTNAAITAALTSAVPSLSAASVHLRGTSPITAHRRLLQAGVAATVQAYNPSFSLMAAANASISAAISTGVVLSAVQAAGVNATGLAMPPPLDGVQISLAVSCPPSNASFTTATVSTALSLAAFSNTSAAILAALNHSIPLGTTPVLVDVSLAPVIGATRPCVRATPRHARLSDAPRPCVCVCFAQRTRTLRRPARPARPRRHPAPHRRPIRRLLRQV